MSKRNVDQYLAMTDDDLNYEIENMPVEDSCNTVRRKIRALIDSGEMKVGELQKAIDVTSNAYSKFMGQHGPYAGCQSSVYIAAWRFFKRRQLRGIKTTNKKAKTSEGQTGDARTDAGAALATPHLKEVHLDGEMEDSVPVFDSCDEIRKKINAYLRKPGFTQAQLLRDIAAQYHTENKKLQASQLHTFRSRKGPNAGNTSAIFYGAYVFFEKLRLLEGKSKSKHRQEMEKIHAKNGGMDTTRRQDRVSCMVGERPSVDKYNRLTISGPNGVRTCN